MTDRVSDIRARLAAVLEDLHENGPRDEQALREIGTLALGLVEKGETSSWAGLKQRLGPDAFHSLLKTLQEQGVTLHKAGHMRPAYAIQVLGLSLVAGTFEDPTIREGERLLDAVIESTIRGMRAASVRPGPAPSEPESP